MENMKTAQELRAIAEAKNKSTEIMNALAPALETAANKGKFNVTFITNGDRLIQSDLEEMNGLGYKVELIKEENGYFIEW
jgi:hypothetical protein